MRFLDGPRITRSAIHYSHRFGPETPIMVRSLSIEVEVVVAADTDYWTADLERDVLAALRESASVAEGKGE